MNLEDLGYNSAFEQFRIEQNIEISSIGRVIAEHKERYIIRALKGEFDAEITGNMRYSAISRENFPAVGDWVSFINYDPGLIINKIFPRFSMIKRKAVGRSFDIQVIAANVDHAFLMQAVDRDFNINRIERYLTICYSSKVDPIIVLSKTDLINKQAVLKIVENIKQRIRDVPVITISNESGEGYDTIKNVIEKGKTYCMLGSSGVGKSTLLNNLSERNIMRTDSISDSTNKGRHITSHRELIILQEGGILIDNPGMREVGIADTGKGLETTFDKIVSLSHDCKFKDCTHTNETGCAILEAVKRGEIDKESYQNYIKMEKEKEHFESTIAERRKREKQFGKMIKNYKKSRDRSK